MICGGAKAMDSLLPCSSSLLTDLLNEGILRLLYLALDAEFCRLNRLGEEERTLPVLPSVQMFLRSPWMRMEKRKSGRPKESVESSFLAYDSSRDVILSPVLLFSYLLLML